VAGEDIKQVYGMVVGATRQDESRCAPGRYSGQIRKCSVVLGRPYANGLFLLESVDCILEVS
jgi:hypothetical protein